MLERATACLKSGPARQSLGHRLSRSKRMLHSMFWNHGAGDLDLPPWAVSMFPSPLEPQSKRDNIHRGRQKTRRSIQTAYLKNSSAAFEGVSLDFLYPPQALAWLQRAQAQQWQRWEKRNARRLPDGFIVAARGYASQPQAKSKHTEQTMVGEALRDRGINEEHTSSQDRLQPSEEPEQPRTDGSGEAVDNKSAEASAGSNFQPFGSDGSVKLDAQRQSKQVLRDSSVDMSANDSAVQGSQDVQAADSVVEDLPSIISEHAMPAPFATDPSVSGSLGEDTLQRLRNIINTSRSGRAKNTMVITKNAIEAYDSLDKDSKRDHRLKRELMEWMSIQPNEAAVSKTTTLFAEIPVAHRTLPTYSAILSIALQKNKPDWFAKLHNEALQNLENGYQVSRTMFRRAIEQDHWPIAQQIEDAHHAWYKETPQIQLFWIHVSEIPQLLQKAIELLKRVRTGDASSPEELESEQRFTSKFFRAAVSQEFLQRDGNASFRDSGPKSKLPRSYIRNVFEYLSQHSKGSAALFEQCLIEILRDGSGFDYLQFHEVVSFVFRRCVDTHDIRPSETLLMLLLRRLTEYYSDLRRHSPMNSGNRGHTRHSLSIPDLVREWEKHYDMLPKDAVKRLMIYHARSGRLDLYEPWLEYLQSNYPNYEDQRDILWTTIWIHARRVELGRAQEAFAEVKRVMSENHGQPGALCWNVLLHAHERADDLEGALTNLQNMINYGGVMPDARTIHGVLQLLARRGDVEGVEKLLGQYDDLVERKRESPHLFSLMNAHINNDNVQAAETVLRQAIPQARNGEIRGSLLRCFNLLLTAHAKLRSIDDTMRTYRWMKEENIRLDTYSYAAIMQALVHYRRTQEAHRFMKELMPRNNVRPTAVHYAILMAGYVHVRQPGKALQVYDEMGRSDIRPTVSGRAAYLKAKAMSEHQGIRARRGHTSEPIRLEETLKELRRFLRISNPAEIAQHQPRFGFGGGTLDMSDAIPGAYVDYLITIHGNAGSMEVVKQLHQEVLEYSEKQGRDMETTSIRLLGSFASAFWRNRRYDDVEKCWQLAKQQADEKASLTPSTDLQPFSSNDAPAKVASEDVSNSTADEMSDNVSVNEDSSPVADAEQNQAVSHLDRTPPPRRTASGRRHFLTRILRYYLLSLHAQGRISDLIKTVIGIIKQGYTMDNKTWNTFVEILCQTSPPLTLLAYVLTERFLTPNFPGWSTVIQYPPKRQAVNEGLQYIKARYLAPGQLMPQYQTLVWLGGALLQLRKSLAVGSKVADYKLQPELKKYVGSVDLIRRHAPKTLHAVQTMPKIPDRLQTMLLRGQNS